MSVCASTKRTESLYSEIALQNEPIDERLVPPKMKCIVSNLYSGIALQNEPIIERLVSPKMKFTLIVDNITIVKGGGINEYLVEIRKIWERTLAFIHGGLTYTEFSSKEGTVFFSEMYQLKNGEGFLLKRGRQTFDFENEKIVDIYVEERQIRVTEKEYETALAKVKKRENAGCCSIS